MEKVVEIGLYGDRQPYIVTDNVEVCDVSVRLKNLIAMASVGNPSISRFRLIEASKNLCLVGMSLFSIVDTEPFQLIFETNLDEAVNGKIVPIKGTVLVIKDGETYPPDFDTTTIPITSCRFPTLEELHIYLGSEGV